VETTTSEVYAAALTLLSHDTDGSFKKLFETIIEWEKQHPPKNEWDGFEWHMVHGDARTLNSLVTRRVLKVVFKSNKYCAYRALDTVALEKALADYEGSLTQEVISEEIPADLLNIVTGHEEKKDILSRSLKADRPVHILLWGSVASAKTLILEELVRLPHNTFVLGSNLTQAGLFEVLFNERPRYLVIDELDKIKDSENLAILLSLMHKGLIRETKYRRHRTLRLKTWVFASANDISHLPKELMSRFLPLRFRDYGDDEFREVVVNVLKEQENVSENLGVYIAERTLRELNSRDVRDCIKIARLLKQQTKEEVDKIIEILKRQK